MAVLVLQPTDTVHGLLEVGRDGRRHLGGVGQGRNDQGLAPGIDFMKLFRRNSREKLNENIFKKL
jgi:hypothetical protein